MNVYCGIISPWENIKIILLEKKDQVTQNSLGKLISWLSVDFTLTCSKELTSFSLLFCLKEHNPHIHIKFPTYFISMWKLYKNTDKLLYLALYSCNVHLPLMLVKFGSIYLSINFVPKRHQPLLLWHGTSCATLQSSDMVQIFSGLTLSTPSMPTLCYKIYGKDVGKVDYNCLVWSENKT